MLHIIGEDANAIYDNFTWIETGDDKEDNEDVETILNQFKKYTNPVQNMIYDQFIFFIRNQEEGETIDQYVNELKTLAKDCGFGDLK